MPGHADAAGTRIFGAQRWNKLLCGVSQTQDHRSQLMQLAFDTLHSSGFENNPDDTTRTLDHMELASIVYIDEVLPLMENYEIYVDKIDKEGKLFDARSCYVGIENVFDVVLTYDDDVQYRFIGTLDALVFDKAKSRYVIEDNKTAARLDEGWKQSFILSHQVSGYLACASALLGFDIFHARILGLKIEPTGRGEDIYPTTVSRNNEDFHRWAFWFRHTADMYMFYKEHYEYAPRYTHSCNRYFRPCALVPFCGDTAEGRMEQYEQMGPANLSPSERAVAEG
jgi:hypothetical protein